MMNYRRQSLRLRNIDTYCHIVLRVIRWARNQLIESKIIEKQIITGLPKKDRRIFEHEI